MIFSMRHFLHTYDSSADPRPHGRNGDRNKNSRWLLANGSCKDVSECLQQTGLPVKDVDNRLRNDQIFWRCSILKVVCELRTFAAALEAVLTIRSKIASSDLRSTVFAAETTANASSTAVVVL